MPRTSVTVQTSGPLRIGLSFHRLTSSSPLRPGRVTRGAPVTRGAQVGVDLLVQHCPTSRDVYVATGEGLNDVQLVQHVIDAAVVREPVESRGTRLHS